MAGTGEQRVHVRETHISVLVFMGDRVYKLRKPLRFGFVNFTKRKARKADCQREVDLNRRLSPDVYLGVADLVLDGKAIDHMVVMRALPEARQLRSLVQSGADVSDCVDATARTLATFHAGAQRSEHIAAFGMPAAVRKRWTDDFREMERFVGTVVDEKAERQIQHLALRWVKEHKALLRERVIGHHVCDGHGDLQSSDVYCLESGVRILDCLEFSDELRWGDICGDVAFLAMDLEYLGQPTAARHFVEAYEKYAGTPIPPALLHFSIAHRAYIRSLVECIRDQQGADGAADAAHALHRMARRHLLRARTAVLLVGGLPGSGKTTLAQELGHDLSWTVLSSDSIRRRLALGPDRYSPQATAAVYGELFRQARVHLQRGCSVVLDASWIDEDQRAQAAQVAAQMDAELLELQCTCAADVAMERIRQRVERQDSDSEASVSVRAKMATEVDPWPSGMPVDTTASSESETLEAALGAIASQ